RRSLRPDRVGARLDRPGGAAGRPWGDGAPRPDRLRAGHRLHPVRVRGHADERGRRRAGALAAPAPGAGCGRAAERLLGVRRSGGAVQPFRRGRLVAQAARESRRTGPGVAVSDGVRGGVGKGNPARGLQAGLIETIGRATVSRSPSSSAQAARQALADQLKEIRSEAGLTAKALAAEAGWDRTKVSHIEHARRSPSAEDIRTWCRVCGVDDRSEDLVASLRTAEGMWVEWRRMERGGLKRAQESVLPLCERTRMFRSYSSWLLPGLLQT